MDKAKKKAQTGVKIPPIQPAAQQPLLNQTFMQQRFGNYNPGPLPPRIPNIASTPPSSTLSPYTGLKNNSLQELLINAATPSEEGQRTITADEFDGAGRYDYFQPSSMGINNEDVAAQYQGWGSKMVNGVLKGGNLALTTFLQGTVGAVNGLYQWANTGKFSSFYDNEFNRALDETNKYLEDTLPNYYTNEELNANWYSPKYWATGNFWWDGVVKNLGFAAGAYASGMAYASALRAIPLTARLFSTGKAAETLRATERGLNATNRGAGVYGEVKALSDNFLNQYNLLNPSGRAVVAGLATQGEAGIEALHNMNEFRDGLIADYKQTYGLAPTGEELERINLAAEGAGNSSFAMNTAVLSASNYIMFPMIGRSGFGRDKAALNNLTRETNKMAYKGGRLVPKVSKLHPLLRTINKIRPYTFSVTEASEEVFQYGAAVASKDYYDKQYNNEPTSWMESLEVGLTDGVFSDEGAKNALIGGISGRLMTIRGLLRRNRQKATNTQRAVEEINNFQLSNFTQESMYAVNRAGVLIEEMNQAAQNGDEFTYKQLEKDFIINYLTPRIKYGRYDLVKQDIADAKKLASTEEGFAQLEAEGKVQKGDSREAYIARMDRLETIANNTNSLWQSLQLRYGGITRENPVTGELEPIYTPSVMDKLIYTGVSTASLDMQIKSLMSELSTQLPDVNLDQILIDILNNESKSFNEANDIITNLDALTEVKDELGKGLQDLAALAKLREKYIQEYQNIQENPDKFREEPMDKAQKDIEDGIDTFVVKTKTGDQELQIGQEYFVGQGVDFNESPLTEPVVVSGFKVLNQNEDGTIRVEQDNGKIKDISPEKLVDYKVGLKGSLYANKTANFYFNHRNDIFEFNFGKNFGGKKKGRLQYAGNKLYFVYKDINGNVLKKQLANKFFLAQQGFDRPRITKIGKVSPEQKRSEKEFLSAEELRKNEQTLRNNRENRQKILNDIGVEQKRRLEELNKQLEKDRKKLAKIKEDFKNIEVMKDGRRKRIKLNFSKAQKNFTQAINKLTEMEADTKDRIKELEAEQEETAFNIAYFEEFGKDLLDLPGNTGEFLKELKDQINLLEQNGKQVASELKSNNDLVKQLRKVSQAAIKILKSFTNEVAFFDQNDNMRLKELLDASLETDADLLQTWPLIKEALADFNLTNDVKKETGIDVNSFDNLQLEVNGLESLLNSLRQEYKAKKAIVDRFDRIMQEYMMEKKAQEKIAKDPKITAQLNETQYNGPQIVADNDANFVSKKAANVIPRATMAPDSDSEYYENETEKEHQVRANTFGANMWKFPNRKNIRGIYVTFKTQDQKLDGVIQRLLDDNQELIDQYKDTAIAMVMIDKAGNLVGVDGLPIPEGEVLLDKAIYQIMPEAGLRWKKGQSMFREGTNIETKDKITEQYANWRKEQLKNTMIPSPFEIQASQGRNVTEDNATVSVVNSDLISEEFLRGKDLVLSIPTTNKNITKGTVEYNSPLGSVYLDGPSGLYKLNNRPFLNSEASAIYDAIYTLSREVINEGATSNTAIRMLNYLKGVTYWGIPRDSQGKRKDTGRNSIFFERKTVSMIEGTPVKFTKLVLNIGPDQQFDFNPADIKKNKSLIINALSQMYINVNADYAKRPITQTFEEIVSVSEQGEVRSITWPNYQTYMLSSENPSFLFTDDAPSSLPSKREGFQIPLTTDIKAIVKGSDETNRKGIYFVDQSTINEYTIEETKPTFISAKGPSSPTAPAKVVSKSRVNALDGKTNNQFVVKGGPTFNFVATEDVNKDNYAEKIKVKFDGPGVEAFLKKFDDAGKDGKQVIKQSIYNFIAKDAAAKKATDASTTVTFTKEEFDALEKKRKELGKKPVSNSLKDSLQKRMRKNDKPLLRVVTEDKVKRMTDTDWKSVSKWMNKNLPGVNVIRVKNIIDAGGKKAYGFFENQSIYIYQNAEVGTAYHEAFEAVWDMYLTEQEQASLYVEFFSRKGSFVDRPTGQRVKYSDATVDQAREELAEEFRDYVQTETKKEKPKNRIAKFIKDLATFIKNLFIKPNSLKLRNELFEKINNAGYSFADNIVEDYSTNAFYKSVSYDFFDDGEFVQEMMMYPLTTYGGRFNSPDKIYQAEYAYPSTNALFRLQEPTLPGGIVHDLLEDMTYNTLVDVLREGESIFEYENINRAELYDKLKTQTFAQIQDVINVLKEIKTDKNAEEVDREIQNQIRLLEDIDENWDKIIKRHQEYLQAYSISFDANDELQVVNESIENDISNKGYNFDARKIDGFRKTNAAIRLLMGTIPRVEVNKSTGQVERVISSVNGVKLLPTSQVYISLLSRLSDSLNPSDMLSKLRMMAVEDPNYRTFYRRVTGQGYDLQNIDYENITEQHQLQVVDALFKSMKKQVPQSKIVTVLPNGEINMSDANIAAASNQMRQSFLNSIVTLSRENKGIFRRNNKGVYNPDVNKLNKYPLNTPANQITFLRELGIPFNIQEYNSLDPKQQRIFSLSVQGVKKSIQESKDIAFFSSKSLNMSRRLLDLAKLRVMLDNPEVSSTFFNVQGERTQTHIGPNVASEIYNQLQQVKGAEDIPLLEDSPYRYLVSDVFSKNSLVVNRYLQGLGGNLFLPGYAGGIANRELERNKKSSQLTYQERLIQEFNNNLEGIYMNLVPADSGMEHTLQMDNWINEQDIVQGLPVFKNIMRGYFIDEVNLARENRKVAPGFESNELRFFKFILGEKLNSEVQSLINDNNLTAEEVFDAYGDRILRATETFLFDATSRTQNLLTEQQILEPSRVALDPEGNISKRFYKLKNIAQATELDSNQVANYILQREANFLINQIEMYKVMYGDPYSYSDISKRSKSFLSPRQVAVNNDVKWNNKAQELWNRDHAEGSLGYTDFTKDFLKTATHEDIEGVIDLPGYGVFETTDGQGIMLYKAYRNFRIRTADWNSEAEKQYAYEIAYEKRDKNQTLTQREKDLLREGNPDVKDAFKSIKPIASGTKLLPNGDFATNNMPVLDKYALYPLSYRVMKQLNAGANNIKLYNKMQREDVDYIIFKSGRKVGAEELHKTYNEDGSFNETPYEGIINIPFNAISLQQEVPSKSVSQITRASQITKIATLDLMDSGKPVDYTGSLESWFQLSEEEKLKSSKIFAEVTNNDKLLDELTTQGLQKVQKRLGIVVRERNGKSMLVVDDFTLAAETLREEIFKRERNDNIPAVLDDFLNGAVVIEGTPAYNEVRNILYSLVQKNIVRPKISGGQLVQISSALFEEGTVKEIEVNGKKAYASDVLKFYEEGGETVMEVMVGRWFNSNLSDKELLDYLNNTEEGQKILRGVAFRIPTQAQNSIDSIKIKQFLPREFGDQVVVPAAIVEKVGSDFDIDKLYAYFKNVFYNSGELQLVPYYGIGDDAKKRFEELYDAGALLTKDQQQELNKRIKAFESGEAEGALVEAMFGEVFESQDVIDDFLLELSEKGIKQGLVDRLYVQSIENEYIQSLQDLIELPEQRERLLAPNNSDQLEKLADEVTTKIYGAPFNYASIVNMLNSKFTSRLRYAFKAGKKGIGVAASNSVGISVQQKVPVLLPENAVPFPKKNVITLGKQKRTTDIQTGKVRELPAKYVTFSGVKNADGEFISNINGQFVDGYVDIAGGPWIMELGAIPQLTPMFLYLVRAGVPINAVTYFMNQPIIRDYVNTILNSGFSYLANSKVAADILALEKYDVQMPEGYDPENELVPNTSRLREYVGKTEFTNAGRRAQHNILMQFMRIYKYSRHMFTINQALNWDTSTFNDPFLVFRKMEQVKEAQFLAKEDSSLFPDPTEFVRAYNPKTREITSVPNAVYDNTFLGKVVTSVVDGREGISNFLKSDQPTAREILENILRKYALTTFDSTFLSIARKATNSLFDYAVQTDQKLNLQLSKYLVENNGVAGKVNKFVTDVLKDPNHPLAENQVIQMLDTDPSKRVGKTPNNIKLRNNNTKIYDQNSVISGFREIKNYLEATDSDSLYEEIVITAILQSGLDVSPISFTQLLPYEDFASIYNPSLSKLEKISNLDSFVTLGMFERNNWNNADIVPQIKAPTIYYQDRFGIRQKQENPGMAFLSQSIKNEIAKGNIPQLLQLPIRHLYENKDYISYTWPNNSFTAKQRKEMAQKGDFSFINKGLFKKVKYGELGYEGVPLTTQDKKGRDYVIFKHVNALGDGFRAQEYYNTAQESVFDNGYLKAKEKSNEVIIETWEKQDQKQVNNNSFLDYTTERPWLTQTQGNQIRLGKVPQNIYNKEDINAQMLTEIGYNEEQIGKILKQICK